MSGRTKKVAEKIAADLKSAEVVIERLKYTKKQRNLMFEEDKIMKGDLSNFKFNELILDLESFDLIILGTPTYGSLPAVPLNGYIEKVKISKINVLSFLTHADSYQSKHLEYWKQKLKKTEEKLLKNRFLRDFLKLE